MLCDVPVADHTAGNSTTAAPLVVRDEVVTGLAGGEFGIRGFIAAFDAASGREIWQFHTVPGPGERSPSYSPRTGFFYVPTIESGAVFSGLPVTYERGEFFLGGHVDGLKQRRFSVRTLDARTGDLRWEFQRSLQTSSELRRAGVLSTAGGLVVTADESVFVALDDESEKELWATNPGGVVAAAPIIYLVEGRQQITVAAGRAIFTFGLDE